MERIVAYAVILLIAINAASTLKCYRCLASPTSDCSEGLSSAMIRVECAPAARNATIILNSLLPTNQLVRDDEIDTVCIGYSATEEGITYFERGCGFIWRGVDICEYLSTLTQVHSCKYCTDNFCT